MTAPLHWFLLGVLACSVTELLLAMLVVLILKLRARRKPCDRLTHAAIRRIFEQETGEPE